MRLPLIITLLSAVMLTACGPEKPLEVRAGKPICPAPIVLSKAQTSLPILPTGFPLPAPTGPLSLLPPDKPTCVPATAKP